MTKRFSYRAVSASGAARRGALAASSRADALRALARSGAIVTELRHEPAGAQSAGGRPPRRFALLAIKQLAVMSAAAVDLLDAIEIVAASTPSAAMREAMRATDTLLRQGERLGPALQRAAPFYPPYVYALVSAGEASGRLPQVLREAARQLEFDQRLARDVVNALTYPAFLVASGALSVAFLFYAVVPRFSDMLRGAGAELGPLSEFVLDLGVGFHDNAVSILIAVGIAAGGLVAAMQSPAARRSLAAAAYALPGLSGLLRARDRTTWARIMAMAIGAGLDVTEAASLAASAIPESRLRRAVLASVPALRAGASVDAAFLAAAVLSPVDASLVRAGQHSGALGEMFAAVADRNEENLRDVLKRLTLVLEPAAIGFVALMIGAIVLTLVSTLAGIYESVGR